MVSDLIDVCGLFTSIIIIDLFYSFSLTLCFILHVSFPLFSLPFYDLRSLSIPLQPPTLIWKLLHPPPLIVILFFCHFLYCYMRTSFQIFSLTKLLFARCFPLHPNETFRMLLFYLYLPNCYILLR